MRGQQNPLFYLARGRKAREQIPPAREHLCKIGIKTGPGGRGGTELRHAQLACMGMVWRKERGIDAGQRD